MSKFSLLTFLIVFTSGLVLSAAAECDYVLIRGKLGADGYTKCVDEEEEFFQCRHIQGRPTIYDGEKCVDSHFQCPQPDGTFRHRNSHLMYIVCRNGVPTKHYCPTGKVFDGQTCASVQITAKSNDQNIRHSFGCPSDGTFTDPESRNNYIVCLDDVARFYQCPQITLDNDRNQQWIQVFDGLNCVTPYGCPEIHGMKKRTQTGHDTFRCVAGAPYIHSCPPGHTYDGRECVLDYLVLDPYKCPETNGFSANPYNESQYYHCTNDRPILMGCPYGAVFSGQSCVIIDTLTTYPAIIPGPYTHDRETPILDVDDRFRTQFVCPYDGVFSDPSSRHRFITCRNRRAYVQHCPVVEDGFKQWNEVFDGQRCVAPTLCPHIDGTSKLTSTGRVYYRCINGIPSEYSCLHGQTFDGQTCVDRREHPFRCPQIDGLFRNPQNDREYYQCINYRPIVRSCPTHTVFDGQSCVSRGHHHIRPNHYKLLLHDRNLVKFEFNNKLIVDTLDAIERRWDRVIRDIVAK